MRRKEVGHQGVYCLSCTFCLQRSAFDSMMFFNHEPSQTFFPVSCLYQDFCQSDEKNNHYTWFLRFYFRPRATGNTKLQMEAFFNSCYFMENEGELLCYMCGQKGHGTTLERSLPFSNGIEIKKWYGMNFMNSTETSKCLEKNLAR